MKKESVWRLVAKALGEKASKDNKEADKIAIIRLAMFMSIFITNGFIVANAIRHWNDETKIEIILDSSTLPEYETPSVIKANRTFEFE